MQNTTSINDLVQQAKFVFGHIHEKNTFNVQNTPGTSISNNELNKFVEKWNPYQNLINSFSS